MRPTLSACLLLLFLSPHSPAQTLDQHAPAKPAADGFVLISGGAFWGGDAVTRRDRKERVWVDTFEMLGHPVTNAEYKLFVDATGHTAPPHWDGGRIPKGREAHPVVFVNRYDAHAYAAWRSRTEKRTYRLPTDAEFEYAARGGLEGKLYPWGDDDPAGRANFNADGSRTAAGWKRFLKPVKSYAPNGYGLYDMAGNAWQMVSTFPDPARARFKYRIENPVELEGRVAGGSWARAAPYLRSGYGGGMGAGMRLPDLGFRVVREVEGSGSFVPAPRRLVALPRGDGRVFLSWQLLPGDSPGAGFHVYASRRRDAAGQRITREPVTAGASLLLERAETGGVMDAALVYLRVRPVADGREGTPSEWAAVEPSAPATRAVMRITPTVKQGRAAPIFGDLDGDGRLDAVVRLDNGIQEMSRDPGVPVELEAFTHDGRALWRRPLVWHDHCFGNANNVPVVVYDLDGDGRAEVIARVQEGDGVYLGVLDGLTGRLLRKAAWPEMLTDFSKSSTRIHLSVAYLDGQQPALVTQTGLYENEVITAYDRDLKKLWEFKSLMETNGSGSHHIDIADVDGDGRDEVFNGTTCLNPDGSIRWAIYRQHPDIVAIKDILPGRPGLEVFYAVESSVHAGAYVVEARTGAIIWKVNREDDPRWTHAHTGWAADIWEGSPGIEMLTNRDGHETKDLVLFAADGKVLAEPKRRGLRPVTWLGNNTRELMSGDGQWLGRFNGADIEAVAGPAPNEGAGNCPMAADIAGDYRDEVVCVAPAEGGGMTISVYTNAEPLERRAVTRTASRQYRLWMARNMGGGYPSYFEPE